MGCVNAKPKDKNDKALDDQLRTGHQEDTAVHKLLLLGAGESGKSTLFKQMITLYGTGFTEKEKRTYIAVINRNIMACSEELAKQSVELSKQEEFARCKVQNPKAQAAVQYFIERKEEEVTMTSEIVQHVKTLWADPAIQATYSLRSKFQLNDSAAYFFDKIDQVAEPGYIPSEQDLLHARIRTTGIIENDFIIEKNRFKMIDVGGQRNERKKWIHCFEGVTAVLFVVDISAYDRVLYEDEKVNRLIESLNLFENICNSRWFRETSIILFLNKSDIFREKIKEVSLATLFSDYTGGPDFDNGTSFIEQEFTKRNHFKKPVYCHVTCATNTQNVSIVFNGVKDIVVREALVRAGLV
jgi:GTPase SAR1 family protein